MGSESQWHHWYGRVNWIKRRRHQLQLHPICIFCEREGRLTPATCIDHCTPHRGNINEFTLGALQSLCASCHSSTKAVIEKRGYNTQIGADGVPIDPRHPFHQHDKRSI
jgi:5-methylcytosine-specific restriction protein A